MMKVLPFPLFFFSFSHAMHIFFVFSIPQCFHQRKVYYHIIGQIVHIIRIIEQIPVFIETRKKNICTNGMCCVNWYHARGPVY